MEKHKLANYRKGILIGLFFFLTLYHAFYIFGIRGIDCPSNWLTLTGPCILTKSLFLEMMLWVAVILLMMLELKWEHGLHKFFHTCISNWPVFIFILFAVSSLIWSIQVGASVSKVFPLIASTLAGIYIGSKFELHKILRMLAWLFVALCLGSLFFVFVFPSIGIMQYYFFRGGWAGIFWHRNYLGCFMALGITVFLVNILSSRKPFRFNFYLDITFFFIAAFLLFKSKSATGIITAVVLLITTLLFYGWAILQRKLKLKHYLILGGVLILGIAITLINLDFLFGLLGRDTSLTGRIPMWTYLYNNVISQRLLFGYGYGALWFFEGFRVGFAAILGWSWPIMIGDNGFVDILAHLGVVGLVILIGLLIIGIYLAVKHLLQKGTLISAFPIIFFVFVLVANISLSLILETEVFTWMLGVALIASIRSFPSKKSAGENQKIQKGAILRNRLTAG